MTEEPRVPSTAVLPSAGHIIRTSTPPRRPSGRSLLTDDSDQRDAQELPEMAPFPDIDADGIQEAREDGQASEARQARPEELARSGTNASSRIEGNGWWPSFRRVWRRHVSLRVPADSRRDHLGMCISEHDMLNATCAEISYRRS
jgi:hypothetical protein